MGRGRFCKRLKLARSPLISMEKTAIFKMCMWRHVGWPLLIWLKAPNVVGVASGANGNDYTLAFGSKGGVLLCVEPDTPLDDFFGDKAAKMTLWTVRQGAIISQGVEVSQDEGHRIDLETWVKLLDLAHKTYVPASEASRLSGAGAGLVDND